MFYIRLRGNLTQALPGLVLTWPQLWTIKCKKPQMVRIDQAFQFIEIDERNLYFATAQASLEKELAVKDNTLGIVLDIERLSKIFSLPSK